MVLPILAVPVTTAAAGALGLYYSLLSLRIGLKRANTGTLYGPGEKKEFEHIVRAQGSTSEYMPVGLILLGLMEANGQLSPPWLKAWAAAFVTLRIAHATQLEAPEKVPVPFRMAGFLGTIALLSTAAIASLTNGVKALK